MELSICAAYQIAEPFLQTISMNLPPITQKYIDAGNAHDVKAILACFADGATVCDENATMHGKIDIERWIATTILVMVAPYARSVKLLLGWLTGSP